MERKKGTPSESTMTDGAALWFEYLSEAIIRWIRRAGFDSLPELRAVWLAKWGSLLQTGIWQKAFDAGEYFFQRWPVAVMLPLLLGMLSVVLLLLDVMPVL